MLRWFARRLNEARNYERGFTLIELLVVRMSQQVAPLCALWITLIKLWREGARLGLDAAAY